MYLQCNRGFSQITIDNDLFFAASSWVYFHVRQMCWLQNEKKITKNPNIISDSWIRESVKSNYDHLLPSKRYLEQNQKKFSRRWTAFSAKVTTLYCCVQPWQRIFVSIRRKASLACTIIFTEFFFRFDLNQPSFFTAAIRSRIVKFILDRIKFSIGTTDGYAFGIDRLISDGVYIAAYPLHDVNSINLCDLYFI